jgi:hypothetical protein
LHIEIVFHLVMRKYGGKGLRFHLEQQQLSRRIMDELSAGGHRRVNTTRPTLGFPLGTTLILVIVFGINALFSCCYRWENIRNMHSRQDRRNNSSQPTNRSFSPKIHALVPLSSPAIFSPPSKNGRYSQSRGSLPVMIPGDDVLKFVAYPSPHGFRMQSIGDLASTQKSGSKQTI